MVIGVNLCVFRKSLTDEESYFITKVLRILGSRYPDYQFYVFYDKGFQGDMMPGNIKPVFVSCGYFWPRLQAQIKVAQALKKTGASVFISFNSFCLRRKGIPQCLITYAPAPGLAYNDQKVSWLARRRALKCFNKADCVVTFSQFFKKQILDQYPIPPEKIKVVYKASRETYRPLDFERHVEIKKTYTNEKEYFFCAGQIHPQKNLIALLKAFSLFKKRQKSGMKLVLTGKPAGEEQEFANLLGTYKYREDVLWLNNLNQEQQAAILCAAYALIDISDEDNYTLEAMQCHVPVLGPSGTTMEEIAEDAGLFFEKDNIAGIADKMMLIYKDENLRDQLIQKAAERIRQFTWQRTVDLLWQSVEETLK